MKNLVEGVVGAGKARVKVTADLELARVTIQEEKFDPGRPGGPLGIHHRRELQARTSRTSSGQVSAAAEHSRRRGCGAADSNQLLRQRPQE